MAGHLVCFSMLGVVPGGELYPAALALVVLRSDAGLAPARAEIAHNFTLPQVGTDEAVPRSELMK